MVPYITGTARLRIPLGTPDIDHILCEDSAVCIVIHAVPVKIFQVLCARMFVPRAGCFPVADKFFKLLCKTGLVGGHISNTSFLTGNFFMLSEHSRRCLTSANV